VSRLLALAVISTSWFSVSERTTATSIASMGYLGAAVAFFAGE